MKSPQQRGRGAAHDAAPSPRLPPRSASAVNIRVGALCGRVYSSIRATPGDDDDAIAPAFVLIHGIGMSHRYLARLHQALAEVGDTYSIELPGFGAAPKPPNEVSVGEYALFIGQALDRLGIDSCVLIGHSMGAQFAIELAVRRPAVATHLVLIGPVVDASRRSVARQALALARDSLREPLRVNAIVLTDYLRCGPRWYLTELPHMMSYPIEDRISRVDVPVLVVRGADDPVAGAAWCRRLVNNVRDARLLEVPRRRHVVQHSAAVPLARTIAAFTGGRDVTRQGG